jgi:hypothetical protein
VSVERGVIGNFVSALSGTRRDRRLIPRRLTR